LNEILVKFLLNFGSFRLLNDVCAFAGLRIPLGMREVPILAVDIQTLNEQKQHGVQAFHRSGPKDGFVDVAYGETITRGLTISSRSSIRHYTPFDHSIFGNNIGQIIPSLPFEMFETATEEVREVSAVLVLVGIVRDSVLVYSHVMNLPVIAAGLPRDLTASILAHEAMHVWMKLSREMPFTLHPKIEEGLCQFVSMKYLEQMGNDGSESTESAIWSEQLRRYFRYQIEMDPSEVYGEGYRQAASCCTTLGLEIVLDHVRDNQQFPSI
jgi:hypothetical protein